MRILAVRGANLASLDGPFAVELGDGTLARAGLFAITGPTGAGKSTILDALCLALFDSIPRLPKGRGVAAAREGEGDQLQVGDVRAVLRRGAGHGFAEVDFVGRDGAAYRARWEVRRARQRARGQLQPQGMSLTTLDGGRRFGDRKGEVLAEIEARLGLSFEQFRRSVLLAQGDFAIFLKAPAKERSALLELLTGTDIYSRISSAAFERCAQERRTLDALEARRGAIAVLSEEERAALEEDRRSRANTVAALEAALQSARDAVAWHERDARLAAGVAAADAEGEAAARTAADALPRRRALEEHRAALPLRQPLADADRTAADHRESEAARDRAAEALALARQRLEASGGAHAEARRAFERAVARRTEAEPGFERALALDGQIATLGAERAQAQAEHDEAAGRKAAAERAADALDRDLAALREALAGLDLRLASEQAVGPLAAEWGRWDSALARVIAADSAARDAGERQHRCAAAAADHEAALAGLEAACTEAAGARDAKLAAAEAIRALPAPALAEVGRRRDALTRRRDALTDLAGLACSAARVAAALREAEAERSDRLAAVETEGAKEREAALAAARAESALAEAETTLRRLHLARSRDVQALRAELREGDPCPVCGAGHHPFADAGAATALDRLDGEQEERVTALRAERTARVEARAGHRAACQAALDRAAALDRQIAILTGERTGTAERWTTVASGHDLPAEPWGDGAADAVAVRLATVEAELAEVARDEAAALDRQARLDSAEAALRRAEAALTAATAALETRRRDHDAARHALTAAGSDRERALRTRDEAVTELEAPFAGLPGWREALADGAAGFRKSCAARVQAFRRTTAERDERAAAIEATAASLAARTVEREAARQADALAARRAGGLADRLAELGAARGALLAGRSVTAVRAELETERVEAERRLELRTMERQAAAARLSAAEQELATRAEAVRRCAARAAEAVRALEAAVATAGIPAEEARRRLARGDGWLAGEQAALAALEAAVREAAVRLHERRELRAAHHAAGRPEGGPEDAAAALTADARRLEEERAALAAVRARLATDADARERLAGLAGDHEAQRARHALWAAMDELIGSRDGQKLRNFAQSLSLDALLARANRYLDDLARRYRLERVAGADLDIQVVDREMADEVRGVHSLSGGEMFLVSLALALGLSSMAARGGGIGTLFIDEGFGTLDPDSLDVALSCLEALQASGRQVGVISHVPAMIDRIGVQVRVEPLGGGRSAVRTARAAALPVPEETAT